ncbi:MAG: subtype A tannase [Atopobiaceae bacterium]|nr:subtype A tannase [Atopobiaceae bacterium]
MNVTRRTFVGGTSAAMLALLSGCGKQESESTATTNESAGAAETSLAFDSAAWRYDADDDVYYQLGVSYCETPADDDYERLAILVPGAYMSATDNGDGTYTCEVDATGKVGAYTATTAPVAMPVNTPGYSAQSAMAEYSSKSEYTGQGLVYLHAGCRGRDHGAPAGVTDLKAAVRFLRAFSGQIPGDAERVFTFGHSGGGAQSALMGATGDAPEYDAYLEAIGAVQGVSDAVFGSMDWCPITNLDSADSAYEWMMGCTRSGLSDEEQAISDALAEAYAAYVNAAQIPGDDGTALELERSDEGIWQAGTYYDRVKAAIEESLNNFLADTSFPYDGSSSSGMGGGPTGGGAPSGNRPDGAPSGEAPSGEAPAGAPSGAAPRDSASSGSEDGISRTSTSGGVSTDGTYETAADYVDALNADGEWVAYDESTNTATVASVAAFCVALKQASKGLGAFDQLDQGQGENTLFGEAGEARHFNATLAQVLDDLGSDYAGDYADDLALTDGLGTDAATRVAMYTPLHYLLASQGGYGQATPAKHWRIRTGIEQGDTALTCELNLALAAKAHPDVESVDFATVWGQGHTEAERTGSATDNLIAWIADCMA